MNYIVFHSRIDLKRMGLFVVVKSASYVRCLFDSIYIFYDRHDRLCPSPFIKREMDQRL